MLTPEQTRLRMYDNEVLELKKENAYLKGKIEDMHKLMPEVLRLLAGRMSWRDAADLRRLADELEA